MGKMWIEMLSHPSPVFEGIKGQTLTSMKTRKSSEQAGNLPFNRQPGRNRISMEKEVSLLLEQLCFSPHSQDSPGATILCASLSRPSLYQLPAGIHTCPWESQSLTHRASCRDFPDSLPSGEALEFFCFLSQGWFGASHTGFRELLCSSALLCKDT